VTTGANAHGDNFAEAHAALRSDTSLQFSLEPWVPPVIPEWAKALGRFLEFIWPVLEFLFWAALAAAVLFLAWMIAQRLATGEWRWPRRARPAEPEEDWRPDEAPARALLAEADALAAAGRFAEAAHLLLFRSIGDIERRRPALVRPALTSRDIAAAPQLPAGPRDAFRTLVGLVEKSLFGGRAVAAGEWAEARDAYQGFAFAGSWRA